MTRTKNRPVDDLLPAERCPEHLAKALKAVGFRHEDVEKWAAVKARAVLDKYKRETGNAVSRADGVAQRNDGTTYPPPQPERDAAAAWIAAALALTDKSELLLALENGLHHLADDELYRLATHLIQRLKIVPPLPESSSLFGRTRPVPARDRGEGEGEGAADGGVIDL